MPISCASRRWACLSQLKLQACQGAVRSGQRCAGSEQPLHRLPVAPAAEGGLQRNLQEEDDGDLHWQCVRHRRVRYLLPQGPLLPGQEVRGARILCCSPPARSLHCPCAHRSCARSLPAMRHTRCVSLPGTAANPKHPIAQCVGQLLSEANTSWIWSSALVDAVEPSLGALPVSRRPCNSSRCHLYCARRWSSTRRLCRCQTPSPLSSARVHSIAC